MNTKITLPNRQFRKLVELVNEGREDKSKKIYVDREPRKVDWKAYTFSQVNNIKESLIFINNEVEKCFLPPKKVGRPFDVKLYTKVVLVCEMFGLTERNAQGFIEVFGHIVGICDKIDDRVIGNAYNKKEVAFILKQIFDKRKDSDGGKDIYTKGTIRGISLTSKVTKETDFCIEGTLIEFFCNDETNNIQPLNRINNNGVTCPTG